MNHEQAIAMLRDCEAELKAFGMVTASVFGSVARNEAGLDSDVDVAVRLAKDSSKPATITSAGWMNDGSPPSSAARSM